MPQDMTQATPRLSGVRIEPAAKQWAPIIGRWRSNAPPNAWRNETAAFREALGLPTDRPVVMTGHQAEFWHPGIIAKYLAAEAAARAARGVAAWIVVDHDTNSPGDIRYPVRRASGALGVRTWRALPGARELTAMGVPLRAIAAESPRAVPDAEPGASVEPSVTEGLSRMRSALAAHATAPSVAQQAALAAMDCTAGLLQPAPTLFASSLSRTPLFARLVDTMRQDPTACARAYNDAGAAHANAGMAPMQLGDDPELPLWAIQPGRARARVRASTLATTPVEHLAPRALLMTALLRLAGCDLFVHGLGGGVYDKVTEEWIDRWLGASLAPTAVVTATLLLGLDADAVEPGVIDAATWRAHHALHDPALLGDAAAAREKSRLVDQIRAHKLAGEDPSAAFGQLHALLDKVRSEQSARLEALRQEAAEAGSRRHDAAIAHDRTWAFPLHVADDLAALKGEINGAFLA